MKKLRMALATTALAGLFLGASAAPAPAVQVGQMVYGDTYTECAINLRLGIQYSIAHGRTLVRVTNCYRNYRTGAGYNNWVGQYTYEGSKLGRR